MTANTTKKLSVGRHSIVCVAAAAFVLLLCYVMLCIITLPMQRAVGSPVVISFADSNLRKYPRISLVLLLLQELKTNEGVKACDHNGLLPTYIRSNVACWWFNQITLAMFRWFCSVYSFHRICIRTIVNYVHEQPFNEVYEVQTVKRINIELSNLWMMVSLDMLTTDDQSVVRMQPLLKKKYGQPAVHMSSISAISHRIYRGFSTVSPIGGASELMGHISCSSTASSVCESSSIVIAMCLLAYVHAASINRKITPCNPRCVSSAAVQLPA
jgi:hypothetical protein